MPEFEPDEESVFRAEKLSSRLMQDLRTVSKDRPLRDRPRDFFSEEQYVKDFKDVPINDVLGKIAQMTVEFEVARGLDGLVPCLELTDGELAMVSLREHVGGPVWPYSGLYSRRDFERFLDLLPSRFRRGLLPRPDLRGEEGIVMIDIEEAEKGIQLSLSKFLSYRFWGTKHWPRWNKGSRSSSSGDSKDPPPQGGGSGSATPPPPPDVTSGGGLEVEVSCRTSGLRIHVSPAYFIDWLFFGHPTTPVTSYVPSGRYMFGGDGPMLPKFTKDHGVFSIPPTYHPSLTRF